MKKLPKMTKSQVHTIPPGGFKNAKAYDPTSQFPKRGTGMVDRGPVGGNSGKGQSQF